MRRRTFLFGALAVPVARRINLRGYSAGGAGVILPQQYWDLLGPYAQRLTPETDTYTAALETEEDTSAYGTKGLFSPPGTVPGSSGFVSQDPGTEYDWQSNNFYDALWSATHYYWRTGNDTVRLNSYELVRHLYQNRRSLYWPANDFPTPSAHPGRTEGALAGFFRTGDYNNYPQWWPNRDIGATQGLSLISLDPRDSDAQTKAKELLRWFALATWESIQGTGDHFGDPRECGYALQTNTLAAWLNIGQPTLWDPTWAFYRVIDYAAQAATLMNSIVSKQYPDGSFHGYGDVTDRPTYMEAIAATELFRYHFLLGPSTTAVNAAMASANSIRTRYKSACISGGGGNCSNNPGNWTNYTDSGGWVYAYLPTTLTVANSNIYPIMSGLAIELFRNAHLYTGDSIWITAANNAYQAMCTEIGHPTGGWFFPKDTNQTMRGARWIQYRRTH